MNDQGPFAIDVSRGDGESEMGIVRAIENSWKMTLKRGVEET